MVERTFVLLGKKVGRVGKGKKGWKGGIRGSRDQRIRLESIKRGRLIRGVLFVIPTEWSDNGMTRDLDRNIGC